MKKYIFFAFTFLLTLLANGATYYVVPNGAGNKDGSSWANAYADVQTAIDSAYNAGGGEVWIKKGTYKHGSAMTMRNGVAIYGGFVGTETSKDQRVAGNNTILDGEGEYSVFVNDYTEENPLTNSAKLDNVTIQNGRAVSGAGMDNCYASPEITNCTFSNNSATSDNSFVYYHCREVDTRWRCCAIVPVFPEDPMTLTAVFGADTERPITNRRSNHETT